MMQILVLGGSSDIGLAVARKFAQEQGANVYLASRDIELLEKKAKDLSLRCGVKVDAFSFDVVDFNSHGKFYEKLDPKPDIVVAAFGYLGEQEKAQKEFDHARQVLEANFLGAVSILEVVADDFEKRKTGTIIGISSVAGERGRKSNYVYGSAKGGFSIYLDGLRHRLFKQGVRVISVLPGFVNTKMTEGMDLPGALTAEVDEVASDIFQAFEKGKNKIHTKWFWKYIMIIIKHIPEKIFLKTEL